MRVVQIKLLILSAILSVSSMQSARAAEKEVKNASHDEHHVHAGHSGHDHTRPDSHAPIGVSGDHLMRKGEIMLSYRYMSMAMDGNRIGTDSVSTPLAGYMVSPLSMDMEMHMLGGMYAVSDKLTLMAMLPYTSISMDHRVNMSGAEFTTESGGIGDIRLASTYGLYAEPGTDLLFNFAINIPTGSIDEEDNTTGSSEVHLPYPMQLGSGT
ncbi:MAG: transporter, partial [Proteobacteria bacterium]|nr:transporter [Pseudomonadota bacterium]